MKKAATYICLLTIFILLSGCALRKNVGTSISLNYPGIEYKVEIKQEPRPLRIHTLIISLTNASYKLDAIIADDPDGNGPAESKLTPPLRMVNRPDIIAAVNANAFEDFTLKKGQKPVWSRDLPVDIKGWAFNEKRIASYGEKGYGSFWMEGDKSIKIGFLEKFDRERNKIGVSGFSPLIINKEILVNPNKDLHPRTAVGVDRDNQRLVLVVVDGRQRKYSEGVSLNELAEYMAGLGCDDALNLDGGGSSIMILRQKNGRLVVANSPCSNPFRPIPVMLVIRKTESN